MVRKWVVRKDVGTKNPVFGNKTRSCACKLKYLSVWLVNVEFFLVFTFLKTWVGGWLCTMMWLLWDRKCFWDTLNVVFFFVWEAILKFCMKWILCIPCHPQDVESETAVMLRSRTYGIQNKYIQRNSCTVGRVMWKETFFWDGFILVYSTLSIEVFLKK